MDYLVHHEIFLGLQNQFWFFYQPRVCASYMWYLIIKSFREILLDIGETVASGRVRNDPQILESRIFNVIFPNEASVIGHILLERYFLSVFVLCLVWVHDQHSELFLRVHRPVDLGQHGPYLEIASNTCRSSPDSGPHRAWPLNQYKGWFLWIQGFLLLRGVMKFGRHENFTFGFFVML